MPLNHAASLKLREAGELEKESVLPLFQLMAWGLANGVKLAHRRTASELLRLTLQADQEMAYYYLLTNLPGGVRELTRRLLRLKPLPAARLLLDILDMRLKADPRNPYPQE